MVRMDIFSIRRSLALLLLFILSISGWHGQLVAAFTTEGTLTYTTAQHTEIQGGEGGLFGNGIIKSGSTAPRAAISAAPTPQRTSPPPGLDPDAAYTLPTNSININQPDLNCPTPTPSTITTTETIKGGLAVSDHSIYITSYLTTSISVTKTVLHNGTICPDIDDGSSSGSSGGVQDDAYPPPYICPMHVLLHNPVSIIGCDNPDAQIVMSATMTTDELGGQGGFLVGTYLTTMKLTQRANDQDGGGNTAAGGEVDLNTVPAPCQVQVQVPSPCVQATTTSTVAVTITTTVNVVVTTTLPHAFNAIVSTMTLLTTVPIATFVSTKTETVVEVSSLGCADGVDVGSQGTTITNVSPNGLPSVLTITSTGREVFTTVTELVGAAARPSHNGLLSVLTVTSAGREVFTTVTGPGVSAATPSLLLVTVNGTPIVYRSERDISPITQAGVAGSGSDIFMTSISTATLTSTNTLGAKITYESKATVIRPELSKDISAFLSTATFLHTSGGTTYTSVTTSTLTFSSGRLLTNSLPSPTPRFTTISGHAIIMQPTPRTEFFHVVETVIPFPNQQSASSNSQSSCYYSIDGDRFGLGVRLGYIFQSLALILGNATRMGFASGRGNTAAMAFALMVPFVYGCIRGTSVWEGEIPLFYPVVSAMCLPSLWWPVLGVDDGSMDALMQGGEDRRIDTVGWRLSRDGADMRVRARRKRWKTALAVWGPYVALSGTYVLVMVMVVYGVLGNGWGKLNQRCDFRPGLIGIGTGRLAGRVEWAVYGDLGLLMGVGGLVLLGVRAWRQINNATGEGGEEGMGIIRREGKWEREEVTDPNPKEKWRVVAWVVISTITLVLCIASVEVTVSRNRIEQPGFNGSDYGQWIACIVGAASLVKLSWSLGVWGRPGGWVEGDERSDDESLVIER